MTNAVSRVNGSGIVAVDKALAGVAGLIVYWRMSGATDLERLRAAWAAEGLDEALLPAPPSPQVALRRAIGEMADRRALVRSLEGGKGLAIVRERVSGDELDYTVELRAYVDGMGVDLDPADHPRAGGIRAAYGVARAEVSGADTAGWLCRMVGKVDALALRDSGGVYFVPRHHLDQWERMVRALRSATGHQVFGIPAMPADETVAAVVDALTSEADHDCQQLEEQVLAGDLGPRALQTRMERADAARSKLARYEEVLGLRLDGVRERIMRASAAVAAAMLSSAPQMELS